MSKRNHALNFNSVWLCLILSSVYGFQIESGFFAAVWLAIAGLWSLAWWLNWKAGKE